MAETLEALLALKRFLSTVQSLVFCEVMLVLESFRTNVTLVRPLT